MHGGTLSIFWWGNAGKIFLFPQNNDFYECLLIFLSNETTLLGSTHILGRWLKKIVFGKMTQHIFLNCRANDFFLK